MRPKELANELEISPKTLRSWLRQTYSRMPQQAYQPWALTPRQVLAACRRFMK